MSVSRPPDPGAPDPSARIHPWRAVAAGQGFEGEAAQSDLPRLDQALSAQGGSAVWPARFHLRFGWDSEGRPVVQGEVAVTVRLTCQRCLDELRIPLDGTIALGLVRSDAEAAVVPNHLDPVLVDPAGVRPLDLVEDELLLALPQIPLHGQGECGPPTPVASEMPSQAPRPEHPFAVLRGLRRTGDEPGDEGEV